MYYIINKNKLEDFEKIANLTSKLEKGYNKCKITYNYTLRKLITTYCNRSKNDIPFNKNIDILYYKNINIGTLKYPNYTWINYIDKIKIVNDTPCYYILEDKTKLKKDSVIGVIRNG